MLRSSIHKPQVLCSDDPILAYGFLNLINLFEKLTVNLYDWISAGGCDEHDSFQVPPAASSIQSSLCNAPIASLQGVLEIQQVDILITQQWLQAMMWKLSMGHAAHAHARATQSGSSDGGNDILPFHLPVIVGKAVMGVIGAASQGAVDAHGIGMVSPLPGLIRFSLHFSNTWYGIGTKTLRPWNHSRESNQLLHRHHLRPLKTSTKTTNTRRSPSHRIHHRPPRATLGYLNHTLPYSRLTVIPVPGSLGTM